MVAVEVSKRGIALETLSKEILAERLAKFYQELKQANNKDYSRSAHVSIRAGINRYLTSEKIGKTFCYNTVLSLHISHLFTFKVFAKKLNSFARRLSCKLH